MIDHFAIYSLADFKKYSKEYLGYSGGGRSTSSESPQLLQIEGSLDAELTLADLSRGDDSQTMDNRNRIFHQCFQYLFEAVVDYIRKNTNCTGAMLAQAPWGLDASGFDLVTTAPDSSRRIQPVSGPVYYEVNFIARYYMFLRTPESWTKEMVMGMFNGTAEVTCELKTKLVFGYGQSLLVDRSEVLRIDNIMINAF